MPDQPKPVKVNLAPKEEDENDSHSVVIENESGVIITSDGIKHAKESWRGKLMFRAYRFEIQLAVILFSFKIYITLAKQ